MTASPGDVRAWRTSSLSTAAGRLAAAKLQLDTAVDDALESAVVAAESWSGVGADAALARAAQEHAQGDRVSAKLEGLIGALRDGALSLEAVRVPALAAVDAAQTESFRVDEHWMVTDPLGQAMAVLAALQGPTGLAMMAARKAALAIHQQSVADAHQALTTVDAEVEYAIDSATDELSATGNDVEEGRTYVPPAMHGWPADDVAAVTDDPRFSEWAKNHPDAAKELLDRLYDNGQLSESSFRYKDFIQTYWAAEAMENAGIDPGAWDPAKGTWANQETITKVYDYYGRLFLDNPDLQWAGMANMIGPSFAGGFNDLAAIRDGVRKGSIVDPKLAPIGMLTNSELKFYETKFLEMQKKIFVDQAGQHEAYLTGGTAETDRLKELDIIDRKTQSAWNDIDQGIHQNDSSLLEKGNKQLLLREQRTIIGEDYDDMRNYHGPVGQAVTYGMTAVGEPSIPGAGTFADVTPITQDVPFTDNRVVTGLPDGNVSVFEERWNMIEQDTLPAYQDVINNEPTRANEIISSDFDERRKDSNLINRIPGIADDLTTITIEPR